MLSKKEKMASVSEMYDVGWEGKTKDKIDSPLMFLYFLKAFGIFFVFLSCESLRESVVAAPD